MNICPAIITVTCSCSCYCCKCMCVFANQVHAMPPALLEGIGCQCSLCVGRHHRSRTREMHELVLSIVDDVLAVSRGPPPGSPAAGWQTPPGSPPPGRKARLPPPIRPPNRLSVRPYVCRTVCLYVWFSAVLPSVRPSALLQEPPYPPPPKPTRKLQPPPPPPRR
jgi:hypothetical protein